MLTRRQWMRQTGGPAVAAAIIGRADAAFGAQPAAVAPVGQRTFCFFSKHLPELDWADLARAVKDAGFDGVDLTVRPRGHVRPERAGEDLPRAIDAIRSQGVSVPMITTDLTSARTPVARPVLQAAAQNGVRFFKPGYWRYTSSPDVRAQVHAAGDALTELAALAGECGIELGFHNHAAYIGAALWEIAPAMDRLDPRWAGYYFDPRHAVAEGGGGTWKAAMRLVASRMKMVALKDFFWSKTGKGWRIEDCPLGEGAVDWAWVAAALRDAAFMGPISLHFEYEIKSGTRHMLDAATRDLSFARRLLG